MRHICCSGPLGQWYPSRDLTILVQLAVRMSATRWYRVINMSVFVRRACVAVRRYRAFGAGG